MDQVATPPAGPRLIAGFETTYLPGPDHCLADGTGHASRFTEDVEALLRSGVTTVRYPLRWHRIESEPGRYDWADSDAALAALAARGLAVIVDLLHHTSHPGWLDDGLRDRRFAGAFTAFAAATAARYPGVAGFTAVNEPFATLFLAGHESLWPPYDAGMAGFVRLVRSVLPGLSGATAAWRELAPAARHVWIDTCEHHSAADPASSHGWYAAYANDRRHLVLDLALGHELALTDRPALRHFVDEGGADLLDREPVPVDVLGLDYYPHSEWWYADSGPVAPSPRPAGFAALAEAYWRRYDLPVWLTETNLRGFPTD